MGVTLLLSGLAGCGGASAPSENSPEEPPTTTMPDAAAGATEGSSSTTESPATGSGGSAGGLSVRAVDNFLTSTLPDRERICEAVTGRYLVLTFNQAGKAGRAKCREEVAAAPKATVAKVEVTRIEGSEATARVHDSHGESAIVRVVLRRGNLFIDGIH